MLQFLRSASKAIPGHASGSKNPLSNVQQTAEKVLLSKLDRRSDHLMPFREHGQSYKWISKSGGPFSAENLRTREGFSSALMWRAITYHAPIVEHHQLFQSLEDWKNTIAPLQSEDYVLSSAYGGYPNRFRVIEASDTAKTIWQMTGDAQTLEWLTRKTKPKYMEMFEFMKEFPQVGNLTAHLLVADYVDRGVIEMPSVREMGRIIFKIKAGALGGLVQLGYLADEQASEEEVINAFESLYQYLEAHLTSEETALMRFNPIMLEHALCKVKRVKDLKHVKPLWSGVVQ
ncbi:hypothetical protein FB451DRAFT_1035409 [Mycena latifolia]|nr:hypothetical protein FB451DRAFT_1054351 [Mycena latifolia]KAJ7474221.1 hypothetical protein FB451DRAFT_1035409 [Mycena latifolia]